MKNLIKKFISFFEKIYLMVLKKPKYCYRNGNDLISFRMKAINKAIPATTTRLIQKYTNNYTAKCHKIATNKSTTTLALEKKIDLSEHISNVNNIHKQ